MKSSSKVLLDSLDILLKINKEDVSLPGDYALKIAEAFENENVDLYNDWMSARDYYHKIEEEVNDLVKDLYKSINDFAEETFDAERKIEIAVSRANDSAKIILSDLGL